jgi:hypothetical protein
MCEPTPATCTATGNAARSLQPRLYALLGDTQYEKGLQAEYASGYQKSAWDAVNASSYPAIGNHEIESGTDAPYCGYFVNAHCDGAARWYAYDIDADWRAIVLDSNRPNDAAQLAWLDSELARVGTSRNLLVYWHHPRWEDGGSGGSNPVGEFMTRIHDAGADIVLWGHDHMYTRWAKLGPAGPAPDGARAFTVGTGGTGLRAKFVSKPGAEKNLLVHGVLELDLRPTSYSWEFHGVNGAVLDSGSDDVTP